MGIIYVLTCHTTNENYIGSTIMTLEKRYNNHKRDDSCVSRHIIVRNNHSIKALEVYETDDRIELLKREQYWMDTIPNINKRRAFTTGEQRIEKNKNAHKKWAEKNKEYILQRARERYYENYDYLQIGDKRRKAWRRTWKADARSGFYNDLLLIDPTLFDELK